MDNKHEWDISIASSLEGLKTARRFQALITLGCMDLLNRIGRSDSLGRFYDPTCCPICDGPLERCECD